MAMTDFTIIRRSMTARLFSTVTTVVTVGVAVALMLVLLSMRDAGERAFARGGGNMHLLVSADTDPMTGVLNGLFYARPPRRPLTWAKYEELRGWVPFEDREKTGQFVDGFMVPVQQGDSFRGFPVLATSGEFFSRFTPTPGGAWGLREGRFFEKDYETVLGSSVARATGLKPGDQIVLTHGTPDSRNRMAGLTPGEGTHEHSQFKYTVVGILRPTGTSHDRGVFTNLESAWIIHAHDRIEREEAREAVVNGAPHKNEKGDHDEKVPTAADLIDDDRKITGIYVRLVSAPGSAAPAVLPQVFDRLRRDASITVSQPKQEIDRLFTIVGGINQILVAMAGVVMISSGIAIMLALYNSMEQRRRQIAILRVLGCSRPRIFGLVITESAMLGLLGAAAGIGVAAAGGFLVAWVLRQRLGLFVEPSLSAVWVVGIAAATVALAAAAGVVPAVMAYRTSVAKNLRPLG
jgi:putative ABC transport system permease protein